MIDVDAYLAAQLPPVLKIGGQEYRGRHLSFNEAVGFRAQMVAAANDDVAFRDIVLKLMEAMAFPEAARTALFDAPIMLVVQVVEDFFTSPVLPPKTNQ